MSFLRKPFKKLKDLNINASGEESGDSLPGRGSGSSTPKRSNSKLKFADDTRDASGTSTPDPRRRSRDLIQEERQRRSMDKERLKAEQKKRQQLARIASDNFMREGPEEITSLYRPFSMNMSKRWNHENRQLFKELDFESQCCMRPFSAHLANPQRREGGPSHYLPRSYPYHSQDECQAGLHRLPATNDNDSGSAAEFPASF
jgi:hypothetical protein